MRFKKNVPTARKILSAKAFEPVYVDTSALVKLYFEESESQATNDLLRTFPDVCISQLGITEMMSALARRYREGALTREDVSATQEAVLEHTRTGVFRCLDLVASHHREAESMLLATETIPLRAADALHLAIARSARAKQIVTFDVRMADAARAFGFALRQPR